MLTEAGSYPVELKVVEDGAWMATFPDLGGVTQGEDEASVLAAAEDLLVEIVLGRLAHGEEVPAPSPADGRPVVGIPSALAARLEPNTSADERTSKTLQR